MNDLSSEQTSNLGQTKDDGTTIGDHPSNPCHAHYAAETKWIVQVGEQDNEKLACTGIALNDKLILTNYLSELVTDKPETKVVRYSKGKNNEPSSDTVKIEKYYQIEGVQILLLEKSTTLEEYAPLDLEFNPDIATAPNAVEIEMSYLPLIPPNPETKLLLDIVNVIKEPARHTTALPTWGYYFRANSTDPKNCLASPNNHTGGPILINNKVVGIVADCIKGSLDSDYNLLSKYKDWINAIISLHPGDSK